MFDFIKRIVIGAFASFLGFALFGVLVLALFTALSGAWHSGEPIHTNSVLHLKIHGRIPERVRPFDFESITQAFESHEDRAVGLYEMVDALRAAKSDSRIQGVYLEIRPFEAGWSTLTSLKRALDEFRTSQKFVYAYADAYDERGLYLATSAEKIFLAPPGEIELKGLGFSEPFLKGGLEKLEIQPRVFRVGKFKAAVEPFLLDKMSTENRLQNQMLIDDLWATVRTELAKFSHQTPEQIDHMAQTLSVSSAQSAKIAGLVTDLGYEDEVLDLMKDKTVGADKDLNVVTPLRLFREGSSKRRRGAKNKIALIFAEGEISGSGHSHEDINSEMFVSDLQEAEEDKDVKAIVIRINSPGGDALASDIIWHEIDRADEKVPVVISMGDVAASGGYYMAASGRQIFAESTTITGSIGVFGLMFGTEKLFKNKLGVTFDRVGTHPYADIGNSNRPMAEAEGRFIQSSVERVYGRFLEVGKEGRNFASTDDVDKIAQGRVWSGTRGREIGLVDELGGTVQALERAAQLGKLSKDYRIEIYPRDEDAITQFIEKIFGESAEVRIRLAWAHGVVQALGSLLGLWSGTPTLSSPMNGLAASTLNQPWPLNKSPFPTGIFARLPYSLEIK